MALAASRWLFLLAGFGGLLLMAGALYLEHGVGLQPCPMCIVQRLFVILFVLVCLAAAIHGPQRFGRRIYALLTLLFAAAGAGTAARQVWLQNVPVDQLGSCSPSLDFMLASMSLSEVVGLLWQGTAGCASVTWTLFGMSVPEWSLLAFVGMILFSLLQLLRRH
ncbi:disulfide bond formation protein B [Aquipseudomonas ullengensis]|uniref:Disulfide bond formation protein B n=1 Tax=Aquipseudomonas ullengensis TaxID=2759166 RepID=A0A7W4Q8U7_9GAMM|nr:disulfide bond formation protein B [Pseudomonas ullengensis]MBB2494024.1 disulfide bond formation protein B [Pseudomonas ullengensis]